MNVKRDASVATFLRSVPVFHDLKGASLDILLPNTGVRMFLNLYHVQNTFKTDNKDHGVMPDIPLQYSLEDRLMGRDPMLEKARERSLGASHQ